MRNNSNQENEDRYQQEQEERRMEMKRKALAWEEEQRQIAAMPPRQRAELHWRTWGILRIMRIMLENGEKDIKDRARNHPNKEEIIKKTTEYFEKNNVAWIPLEELEDLLPTRQEVKQSSGGWESLREKIKEIKK